MRKRDLEKAYKVKPGDRIVFRYERPVEVLKKKTSRTFTKCEIVEAEIVEGSYFQQLMDVNGIHKEQEVDRYEKIDGLIYRQRASSEIDAPLYLRVALPKSKIKTHKMFWDDQAGKEVRFESIKEFLRASELKPSQDIQDRAAEAGHELQEKIVALTYRADRILEFDIE